MKYVFIFLSLICLQTYAQVSPRQIESFNKDWTFVLADVPEAREVRFQHPQSQSVTLPHDWSIGGQFSKDHLTTTQGGALPTGIGWYRKTFTLPVTAQGKRVSIEFDGVHRNSEVWINGHSLGVRPSGYSSFQYDLTPHLKFGTEPNVIAVRVDNSVQPNSRWYTGSGIYRNVRLVTTSSTHIRPWGVFVTTPNVTAQQTQVQVQTQVSGGDRLVQTILDATGQVIATQQAKNVQKPIQLTLSKPTRWSIENPYLYTLRTQLYQNNQLVDQVETLFGVRSFRFDASKGFYLNDQPTKILGVCLHHDLGALGAAVHVRAMERQLELLKAMGCNAIRTSHNPPAPEFLDLCDRMGFLVMDEAFDMWKKKKSAKDYSMFWDQEHRRDLEDLVKRDRNHPSIILWSIGNEIREQFDSTGTTIAKELVQIVKNLDTSRPVTSALTENIPEKNFIYQSKALDILGFNYKHEAYADLPKTFPHQLFLPSETVSGLQTRGDYIMPSDSLQLWPRSGRSKLVEGNIDFTASAYDNVFAYWGSTHEDVWKVIKKYPHLAGCFVWSGFDFLGEPHPYPWPARSSYYGIIDLAGFPKDVYYMYQSEWTNTPMLHLFPHWNWEKTQTVDVWAYYNQADEVELFLNGKSLGTQKKTDERLHVQWRVKYEPGTLKAISRKNGKTVLTKEIHTAGKAARIELVADRKELNANGKDLSFVTVRILDEQGNLVSNAGHLVHFDLEGEGTIAGVDNGFPASTEPFQASYHRAYNGLCLAIIRTHEKAGTIRLKASAEGLKGSEVVLQAKE